MNDSRPAGPGIPARLKIAFIKRKRFSHINAALHAQLERCFPEFDLEEIDVFRDFILRRPDVVLRNLLEILRIYGRDILHRRRKLLLCFYRTPYIFQAIREWLRSRLGPRRGEFAFSFSSQSLYDASIPGLPHFLYTDHTHLANLYYPHFAKSSLFAPDWITLEREIYQNAARVFVPGEHVLQSLREQYGCESERTWCVHAGINFFDETPPPLSNDDFANQTIVFVGVDWPRKGGPELIEAFERVRQRLPNARLTIIGCTPSVRSPGIHIAARIPIKEVARHLSESSVFCLPSRIEPFGIAVLEAFACGLPAVVTRVGALGGLVRDRETGRVVEPGNPAALADALVELLSDPEKCQRYGEAGRRYAQENGTWHAVGDKLRTAIQECLPGK